MKYCPDCETSKEESCFYANNRSKDGLGSRCKECIKIYGQGYRQRPEVKIRRDAEKKVWRNSPQGKAYHRQYFLDNKDELTEANRAWERDHPEAVRNSKRKWTKKDKLENPTRAADRSFTRRREDPNFRLKEVLRARLRIAVKKGFKNGSAVDDLGCSIAQLRVHLESKFQPNMTWENWGKGFGCWNIDHIIPLAAFDLTDRQHVILACNYLNLQPLWFEDNMAKGDKLEFDLR